jgi:desulfoferrodoxin-like iron-binding protein
MGKRYVCASCGSEMLVTRAGDGTLACCGQEMQLRAAAAPQAQQPAQPASSEEARRG